MSAKSIEFEYDLVETWEVCPDDYEWVRELPIIQKNADTRLLNNLSVGVSGDGSFFLFFNEWREIPGGSELNAVANPHWELVNGRLRFKWTVLPISRREAFEIVARAYLPDVFHREAGV